ncbi:response regulator [Candidatus Nitrospira salsa]
MNAPLNIRAIDLLLIEDSPGDVLLIKKALKDAKVLNNIQVANDGVQAMAVLRKETPYFDAPRPDLILLDLNIPKKDGREVLKEIKQTPDLRSIPVVILTTSTAEADVLKSYDLHANAYITKPMNVEGLIQAVKMMEGFWFSIVTLPPKSDG